MKNLYILLFILSIGQYGVAQQLTLKPLGVFTAGPGIEATEILSYDASTNSVFVVNSDLNTIQRLDISDPSNPSLINTISLDSYGSRANSVAVAKGMIAAAVENHDDMKPGYVVFFDLDGKFVNQIEAGVLPDMLTFNYAGTKVLVANEGEPSDDYANDPEGSVSIIDVSNGAANASGVTLRLHNLGDKTTLNAMGVRIFGPDASVAQDLEPEYITVAPNDEVAFVVCQENNAVVTIDLLKDSVSGILPLGYKNYGEIENGIDASDKNPNIDIRAWDNVYGMYQPDGMVSYEANGITYFVTANEGDARKYDGYSEEVRVNDLVLDSAIFQNAASIQMEENLGRLKTSTAFGDTDGDGDHDVIYSYGARSFSIFSEDGTLVYDSGNEFVTRLQNLVSTDYVKKRSDDKGSEPESITLGVINNRTLAFIGLESQSGFFIFDITNPNDVSFAGYGQRDGDIGPESAVFVSSMKSGNGNNLLVTANEVSGTVTVFEVVEGVYGVSNIKIFPEKLTFEDYEPATMVMPPSPLTTQVIFVGGHDIVQTTPTYGNPAGRAIAKEWHDFIGFTPDETGNSLGWISVNHEMIYHNDRIGDGGGMTVFQVGESSEGIEVLEQTLPDGRQGHFFNVDFVNTVGETGMNCAGISAPNGRIWTAEEWYRENTASIHTGNLDASSPHSLPIAVDDIRDGLGVRDTANFTINAPEFPEVDGMSIPKYQNFNYMVEIDPKNAIAIRKQYNWGRAGWEGGAITPDGKYAYLGIDGVPAPWVRVTANTPWDFTDVILEVYKHDNQKGQRWIPIDMNVDNMLGGLTNAAWEAGATMYMRNEWVAIGDNGTVFWTETGRDSGSSGPGKVFSTVAISTNAVIAPHHNALAQKRGFENASDENYQDYYGRVLFYDPRTEDVGVVVEGGPYFASSPTITDYPDKHLSNPDGLNILTIDGRDFLMIQEDLNGSSFGRMPEGISNRMCELYLLPVEARNANTNDLIRITAIPAGAEITGAIQISDNTILVNSQHPNANNPFPFNHSLTLAIHGWANLTSNLFELPSQSKLKSLKVIPNPATREVFIAETTDFAIYSIYGQRIKVFRNTNYADVSGMESGTYLILTANNEVYRLIIE